MANCASQKGGKKYWKSLKEYSGDPEFLQDLNRDARREFPEGYDDLPASAAPMTRRTFVGLVSASMALTATACRRPDHKIVPAVQAVEYIVPGLPNYYTSVAAIGNVAYGIEIKTREGRPIKIEGNKMHPVAGGASNSQMQADILSLYDPDRMTSAEQRNINDDGSFSSRSSVPPLTAIRKVAAAIRQAADSGRKSYVLIDEHASPSFAALCEALESSLPNFNVVAMPALYSDSNADATNALLGIDGELVPDLAKADVIVTVDADILGTDKHSHYHRRTFARKRKPSSANPVMNRLVAVESVMTLTGLNADERVKIEPGNYVKFLAAVLKSVASKQGAMELSAVADRFAGSLPRDIADQASKIAEQLTSRGKQGFVAVAAHLPATAHALGHCINYALGALAYGGVLDPRNLLPHSGSKSGKLAALRRDLKNGAVGAVLFADVNPMYSADHEMHDLLRKVAFRAAFTTHRNESAQACHVYIPSTHYLEAWGDVLTFDGTLAVQQPVIAPLNEASQSVPDTLMQIAAELDNALGGLYAQMQSEYELEYEIEAYVDFLRARWEGEWYLAEIDDVLGDTFDKHWEMALRNGMYKAAGYRKAEPLEALTIQLAGVGALDGGNERGGSQNSEYTCAVFPDAKLVDGRYANNGWLQELPDPVTKVTWDNVALLSSGTAAKLGVKDEDLIRLSSDQGAVELPVLIQPGMVDNVIGTSAGYGRTMGGVVQEGVGANTFALLAAGHSSGYMAVNIEHVGRQRPIATTQNHHTLYQVKDQEWMANFKSEDYGANGGFRQEQNPDRTQRPQVFQRPIIEELTLTELKENKSLNRPAVPGREEGKDRFTLPITSNAPFEYKGHRWGMTIDLSQCTGCNSCVIACQAENNIATIGKEEVIRGRELHWMRLDRYYAGDPENPTAAVQPLICQHCENAPCENVCPVAATSHSPEGLNEMTYNRCVGTRYCLNNCPYKVRRYNFLNYHEDERSPIEMAFNPDVTVRMRGIMEKCTFCIQRITQAKFHAKDQGRSRVLDGEVVTACEQACPANAILFGDTNNPESRVSKARKDERGYLLLEDLNVRPQVTYLAKVRSDREALA